MKKYKLLKPIPGLMSGWIAEEKQNGYTIQQPNGRYYGFPKDAVEDNPAWFQLIPDEPKRWRPKEGEMCWFFSSLGNVYCFPHKDDPGNDFVLANCFPDEQSAKSARDQVRELLLRIHGEKEKKECEHFEHRYIVNGETICRFPGCDWEG